MDEEPVKIVVGKDVTINVVHTVLISTPTSSRLLGPTMWDLGLKLGIPPYLLTDLRRKVLIEISTWKMALHDILGEWVSLAAEEATIDKLLEALLLHELKDIAGALTNKFACNPLQFEFQVGASNEESLTKPEHENELTSVKDTLPNRLPYYVTRTLRSRNVLSDTIFETGSDVFLISGITFPKLSIMVKKESAGNSGEQLMRNEISSRFLVLNHVSHFEKICEKMKDHNVHWIAAGMDGKLRWVKSRGNVTFLNECIDKGHLQDIIREEDFCTNLEENSNAPVCIVDSPGMGKSMLLAEMGRRLKELHQPRAVIFLSLSEFIGEVEKIQRSQLELATAIQIALESLACENDSKVSLKDKLRIADKTVAVELLLDGLDEVQLDQQPLAYEVLQTIQLSFTGVRMWVTSRSHLLRQLEMALNVLGHYICPFNRDDQIHSITSYWTTTRKDLNTARLNQFADRCLQNLHDKLSSNDADIAGIPLQCLMIAEVFEEPAHIYAESDEAFSVPVELQLNSIADMYRLLIQRKLDKYKKIYGDSAVDDEVMLKMHTTKAFELLFPKEIECPLLEVKLSMEEVRKVGLVEGTDMDGSPRFIHRTFAEYLVTRFVADWLLAHQGWTETLSWTLVKLLTIEEFSYYGLLKHRLVAKWEDFTADSFRFTSVFPSFLNCMIHGSSAIPESMLPLLHPAVSKIRAQLLHACIHAGCLNLAQFLVRASSAAYIETNPQLEQNPEINPATPKLYLDLLQISAQVSSLPIFRFALEEFQQFNDFSLEFQWRILQLVMIRGHVDVAQSLLNEIGLRKYFSDFHTLPNEIKELLYVCVANSGKNSKQSIDSRIEMTRFLVGVNPEFVEHKLDTQLAMTPLLCSSVHLRLLLELIQLGANVFAQDFQKNTVLHIAGTQDHLSSNDCHSIVTAISLEDMKKLVYMENDKGNTPLQCLVEWKDTLSETLSRLQEAGANFNCFNKDGDSILATAVMKRIRDVSVLRNLIKFGADVTWKHHQSQNNLLQLAVLYGNLEAAMFLVQESGFNPKERTAENQTILHLFCISRYLYRFEVTESEISSFTAIIPWEDLKTLVHVEDDEGNTPLHCILHRHGLPPETLSWFQEAGANFNHRNKKGYSVLATAVMQRKDVSVLRKLIIFGADVTWKHHQSQNNLLQLAVQYGNLKAAIFLVQESGFNPKERTAENRTILHLFCICYHWYQFQRTGSEIRSLTAIIPWEELKTFVHVEDDKGETPLHCILHHERLLPETLSWFQEAGANFNHRNKEGYSVLATAVMERRDAWVLRKLIECGADVGFKKGWKRKNLLHYAAQRGNAEAVEFLVSEMGFDVNERSLTFSTPLSYAETSGYWYGYDCVKDATEALKRLGAK